MHDHLEALHIKLSDKDTTSTAGKTAFDSTGDSKMQNVINYLRHAKEIVSPFSTFIIVDVLLYSISRHCKFLIFLHYPVGQH